MLSDLVFLESNPAIIQAIGCSAISNPFLLHRVQNISLQDGGALSLEQPRFDSVEVNKFIRAESIISREMFQSSPLDHTNELSLQSQTCDLKESISFPSFITHKSHSDEQAMNSDDHIVRLSNTQELPRNGREKRKSIRRTKKPKKSARSKAKKSRIKALLVQVEELRTAHDALLRDVGMQESELHLLMTRKTAAEVKRKEALEFKTEAHAYRISVEVIKSENVK